MKTLLVAPRRVVAHLGELAWHRRCCPYSAALAKIGAAGEGLAVAIAAKCSMQWAFAHYSAFTPTAPQ
jgi:hypothetical protein